MTKNRQRSERGRLLVFEGPDGTGKTTIARKVVRSLRKQGIDSQFVSFPGTRKKSLGRLVYEIHHKPSSHGLRKLDPLSLQVLHVAAHISCIRGAILPLLEDGTWVILDRFWWSTYVYGRTQGEGYQALRRLLEVEWPEWGNTIPDLVFLLGRAKPIGVSDSPEWHQIKYRYERLAKYIDRSCNVRIVTNDGLLVDALRVINDAISLLKCERDPTRSIGTGQSPHNGVAERFLGRDQFSAFTGSVPIKETPVFDTYWRFATKRNEIFFKRFAGCPEPWTDDKILQEYRFTNVYRASDRTSQYLIRNVIYSGESSPTEVVFRILLFKLFNRIGTWELLKRDIGAISAREFDIERYDRVLERAIRGGKRIYSPAYIMPSGSKGFREARKHKLHLRLLCMMMEEDLPSRVSEARSMRAAYDLLRSYPTIGDFLAYQFVVDINYSNVTNFSEMEFVVPGPGARSGIRKCFESTGGLNETEVIHYVTERQALEFESRGLEFKSLWDRPLQLIDCQNLFCEVDKYSRHAHPDVHGTSQRTRIKRKFVPSESEIDYWFPPKWGLNERIEPHKEKTCTNDDGG